MTDRVSDTSLSALIAEYSRAAAGHGHALRIGNSRLANKHYRTMAKVYGKLKLLGITSQHALLPLISHADPSVRLWAGAHVLEFAPDVGTAVLIDLANGPPSPQRLSAETTLEAWRRGQLSFP